MIIKKQMNIKKSVKNMKEKKKKEGIYDNRQKSRK